MKSKDLLKIVAWDVVNPFILSLKKNRRYTFPERYNGVNLGCGIENPANWIGIDGGFTNYVINKYPALIPRSVSKGINLAQSSEKDEDYMGKIKKLSLIHHELNYGVPFHDNSIPNVYSSHFFEHLFKDQAVNLLTECFRATKSGGIIRICVPSLEEEVEAIQEAVNNYKNGNNRNAIQHFITVEHKDYLPAFSNHRWMYDFTEMSEVLANIGYINITRHSYRKGQIPDVEALDTRDGLFVEAVKP